MEALFGYYFHPAVQEILHVHEQAAESEARFLGR